MAAVIVQCLSRRPGSGAAVKWGEDQVWAQYHGNRNVLIDLALQCLTLGWKFTMLLLIQWTATELNVVLC